MVVAFGDPRVRGAYGFGGEPEKAAEAACWTDEKRRGEALRMHVKERADTSPWLMADCVGAVRHVACDRGAGVPARFGLRNARPCC
jgi:hypothetical protein